MLDALSAGAELPACSAAGALCAAVEGGCGQDGRGRHRIRGGRGCSFDGQSCRRGHYIGAMARWELMLSFTVAAGVVAVFVICGVAVLVSCSRRSLSQSWSADGYRALVVTGVGVSVGCSPFGGGTGVLARSGCAGRYRLVTGVRIGRPRAGLARLAAATQGQQHDQTKNDPTSHSTLSSLRLERHGDFTIGIQIELKRRRVRRRVAWLWLRFEQ